MIWKAFVALAALVGAALYYAHDSAYARTVDASPDRVAEALADLDMTGAPGAPGTDPMRSGGVPSDFAVGREGNDMVWTVMNGGQVAVRLIAHLTPAEGGKTRVTLDTQRGDAPDDHVAPAFRSRGVTMGLFAMMVEGKLDTLTMPKPHEWDAGCQEIIDRFSTGSTDWDGPQPHSLTQAVGHTAATAMRLSQIDKELKLAGCPTNDDGRFHEVSNTMGEGIGPAPTLPDQAYVPGKPMIDSRPPDAR